MIGEIVYLLIDDMYGTPFGVYSTPDVQDSEILSHCEANARVLTKQDVSESNITWVTTVQEPCGKRYFTLLRFIVQ
jgi:hypothetical protein